MDFVTCHLICMPYVPMPLLVSLYTNTTQIVLKVLLNSTNQPCLWSRYAVGQTIYIFILSFVLPFFPLHTIVQLCRGISSQLRHILTIEKKASPDVFTIWSTSAY